MLVAIILTLWRHYYTGAQLSVFGLPFDYVSSGTNHAAFVPVGTMLAFSSMLRVAYLLLTVT